MLKIIEKRFCQWAGSVNIVSTAKFPISFNRIYQLYCTPKSGNYNPIYWDVIIPTSITNSSFRTGSISNQETGYAISYIVIGN